MAADQQHMQRAIHLAAASAGLASPNPQVGCVLTRKDKVIGEGAHLYAERDHAEIVALKAAASRGIDTAGATAYVTLEPCSHHGRTGPCADALIAAGITRCVVATVDPNPQVSGRGIAKLRAAGIEVLVGVCQRQAQEMNDAFAHFIQTGRPFVTLKAALSVDGKLAPPPATRFLRQPAWLTGEPARAEVQQLRHASDAILTGVGTILADDPALTDRTGLRRRRHLLRIVLDTLLRTPLDAQIVRGAEAGDVLILCGTKAPSRRIEVMEAAGVEVLALPEHAGHLSLPAMLSILSERQMTSLLLETGSALNGSFLAQNLVDKIVFYYSQVELGAGAIPFARGIPSPYVFEERLARVTRRDLGQDAVLTGYLHDPWK